MLLFNLNYEAKKCLLHQGRFIVKHLFEQKMLWFPKLYENAQWENHISSDENEIYELEKNNPNYLKKALSTPRHGLERIVFARVRSNLGDVMYRFKGVFKLDPTKSQEKGFAVYLKQSNQCRTYQPQNPWTNYLALNVAIILE